jgi:protein AbiQ
MESLKLYTISDAYISYLREFSPKTILRSEGEGYVTSRKYLGVVYEINCYQYFAPFSSPKDSDYFLGKNGKKEIRRSIIPIIRMTETFSNGEKGLLATIKLNNMIPVPVSELEEYDIVLTS